MYTMVLMMAMGGSADVPDFGRDRGGCTGSSCKGDRGGFLGLRDRDRGGCHGAASCHGAVVVAASCHGAYAASCHGAYAASCYGSMSCHGSDRGGFLGLRNRNRDRGSCHGYTAGCHGAYYGGSCHGYVAASCCGYAPANCCGVVTTTGCTGVIVGGAPAGALTMPPPPATKEGTGTKKEE